MFRLLYVDLWRLFHGRRFYCSVAGMAVLLWAGGILYTGTSRIPVRMNDCFSVANSGGFFLLFYALCVLGGGMEYCADCRSRFVDMMMARAGMDEYVRSKTVVSVIGGYLAIILGLSLYSLLMSVSVILHNGTAEGLYTSLDDFVAQIWFMLIVGLLGAVLSVFGFFVTSCVPNVFMGVAMPIVVYYVVIVLTNRYVANPVIMPACVYFRFDPGSELVPGGGAGHFLYAFIYSACIIYILYKGAVHQIKRGNGYV